MGVFWTRFGRSSVRFGRRFCALVRTCSVLCAMVGAIWTMISAALGVFWIVGEFFWPMRGFGQRWRAWALRDHRLVCGDVYGSPPKVRSNVRKCLKASFAWLEEHPLSKQEIVGSNLTGRKLRYMFRLNHMSVLSKLSPCLCSISRPCHSRHSKLSCRPTQEACWPNG